jgi:phosphatidate cytidylyltransferase
LTHTAAGEGKAPAGPGRELLVRFGSALALAVVALAGAVVGGWAAAIVIAVAVVVVHREWSNVTGERDLWPSVIFTAALVVALAVFTSGYPRTSVGIVAVAAVAAAVISRQVWPPLGVIYAGVLGLGLLALRLSEPLGLLAVLFVFAVVWGSDTGAFFAGRAFGGPKLWPRLSPKKTWSGAVGGLIVGVALGALVLAAGHLPVSAGALAVALVLAIACQAGDLFESFVKRLFGAKDSGRLIPGHGGLMDRVDGLVAAAGLAALIGLVHGGASVGQGLVAW